MRPSPGSDSGTSYRGCDRPAVGKTADAGLIWLALGWLWGGFGVALGWLCTPKSMPSLCLVYGFVVASEFRGRQRQSAHSCRCESGADLRRRLAAGHLNQNHPLGAWQPVKAA
jgi:hypothetical protein